MTLRLVKFGPILNSRPAGREVVLRAKQILNGFTDTYVQLDFSSVEVLTPSFADEFIKGLKNEYADKKATHMEFEKNVVIKETLALLGFI
ncbi:hypothetical protein COZ40_01650 [Candidatus Roizmanbacteria bacterium CG_4_10_14_3_um_filter_39_13]|uniref:DUF4325 domain-containing protein n=1 Tax=Candidatus Roizmanbacteria bacterium CG_4_10_14_3_um_filter_39_13 TaxID=1974831 RepID=A0A2M7LL11_9BACT|nr:MAG: hypothetical protein COZ40_01650 [Candidatus Roizmanbacteria bacterium CG_4_10_14_3_um_filter_39_13]